MYLLTLKRFYYKFTSIFLGIDIYMMSLYIPISIQLIDEM